MDKLNLPVVKEEKDKFSVGYYLANLDYKNLSSNDLVILDKLCKKVDVVKRLRSYYSLDLSSAAGEENLPKEFVEYFCAILLEIDDYKFLNTALKLLDDILGYGQFVCSDELVAKANARLDTILLPSDEVEYEMV